LKDVNRHDHESRSSSETDLSEIDIWSVQMSLIAVATSITWRSEQRTMMSQLAAVRHERACSACFAGINGRRLGRSCLLAGTAIPATYRHLDVSCDYIQYLTVQYFTASTLSSGILHLFN